MQGQTDENICAGYIRVFIIAVDFTEDEQHDYIICDHVQRKHSEQVSFDF